MANRLPLHQVDELVRHFDAGRGVRATARATGHSVRTVARYRRLWLSGASRDTTTIVCRLSSMAAARTLLATARERGETPSIVASHLMQVILDEQLVNVVLA